MNEDQRNIILKAFLKEFEKEEIVKLNGKDIVIINPEKLEQISKNG